MLTDEQIQGIRGMLWVSYRAYDEGSQTDGFFSEEAVEDVTDLLADREELLARVKELEETLKADYETMIRMGWGCSTDPLLRRCAETTRAALDAIKE